MRRPLQPVRVNGGENDYTTPLRPEKSGVPSSLWKGWMMSSPGNADAAASLGMGLVTPGMSGVVGIETPRLLGQRVGGPVRRGVGVAVPSEEGSRGGRGL